MTCGDVPVLSASADASHGRDPEQMAEVHVDIRKLLQFLAGQQSTPTKAVCSECALASFFAGHNASVPWSRALHAVSAVWPSGVWVPRPALGARRADGGKGRACPQGLGRGAGLGSGWRRVWRP